MNESPGTSNRHRIVVGMDGSASSTDALRWAAQIAAQTGAQISIIICWQYPPTYGMSGAISDWDPKAEATQILSGLLTTAFGDGRPDGLRTCIREGHPAQVLVEASVDADMLVVGSRGHGGFAGLLLGSVSTYCTVHGKCPVVVVPHARIISGAN